MRIAIVEDEQDLANALSRGLASEGHEIELYHTATIASSELERNGNRHDLIILDLMLPDGDGKDVCTGVREAGITTPVLVLTARDSVDDRVELLDRGADDFLGKPFSFDELLARVRALSRRGSSVDDVEVVLGELRLLPARRLAYRANDEITLTPREFDLLHYLVRNRDRVIDRGELMAKVWRGEPSHTNVVDVHVRKLRMKLDEGREKKYIRTTHGVGYAISD